MVPTRSPNARPGVPRRPAPRLRRAVGVAVVVGSLALTAGVGTAAAQRLTATIDRTSATAETPLRLTLTVVGSQQAQPQLPELPDFDVTFAGQTTQLQVINGRATSSVQHDYLLLPKSTGTFTIPPATVEIEGRHYESQPITVRIVDAETVPQSSRSVFVTASVSTREPYLGQQVLFTWRLYSRVRIGDPRLDLPDFEGFLREDLGDVREYEATLNGQGYRVSEFHKALFPQEVGKLTIPATTLNLQVEVSDLRRRRRPLDSFFGRTVTEPRVLRTDPIEIDVRPLPAAPADFSGLVGDFRLSAKLSKHELEVGQSATLTYTITGTGNAQMISEPELPELTRFKIYDDKPSIRINRSDSGISGSKSYSKALVPLVPGELTLPPVSLSYFDVEAGSYRVARAPELRLQVLPAEGEEELRLTESMAPTTGKVAVQILADDILPLHRGLEAVEPRLTGTAGRVAFFTGLLAPGFLFAGLVLLQRRRERFGADWRRRRDALRRARVSLADLSRQPDSRSLAHTASLVVRGYVGDRLGLEGRALTPVEAAQHLQQAGADPGLAAETEEALERLEAIQYGAAGATVGDLQREIADLLQRLEAVLA